MINLETTTEGLLKTISQILVSIVPIIIAGFIQVVLKVYSSLHEKNKYIKLLKNNFSSVEDFLNNIKTHKINLVYFSSYMFFIIGVIIGFLIELVLGQIIVYIFDFVIDVNYIAKLLDTSPNVVFLNGLVLCCSFFNIGIFLFIFIFILWCRYIYSKKLSIPKVDKYGTVNSSSQNVYLSFWFIIGNVFGLNSAIFFYLIGISYELSLIDKNLSFNRTQFDLISTHLMYPGFHIIAYVFGFILSLSLIIVLYYGAKLYEESIIKSITNFYKYDFPYVTIKTESGEIKGQLREILDKYLITLSENNVLKTVRWDKIETMEIQPKNKDGLYIFNDKPAK